MQLLLFMHGHSSPLSLAARLHQCCTNHSHYINNGWTFSRPCMALHVSLSNRATTMQLLAPGSPLPPSAPFLSYLSEQHYALSNCSGGVISNTEAKGPENKSLPHLLVSVPGGHCLYLIVSIRHVWRGIPKPLLILLPSSFCELSIFFVNYLRNVFLLNLLQISCFSLIVLCFHFFGMWALFLLTITKEVTGSKHHLLEMVNSLLIFSSHLLYYNSRSKLQVFCTTYFQAQSGENGYCCQVTKTVSSQIVYILDDGGDMPTIRRGFCISLPAELPKQPVPLCVGWRRSPLGQSQGMEL